MTNEKKLVYYRAENFDGILSKLIAEGQKVKYPSLDAWTNEN